MSEWISVKDKLPDLEEEVLACAGEQKFGRQIRVAYLHDGLSGVYWTYYDYMEWHDVTHWMPLLKPPEES